MTPPTATASQPLVQPRLDAGSGFPVSYTHLTLPTKA